MRPLALLAASIPLALGCAQQSLQRASDVGADQPLQVTLHNPTGGGLTYSLSEPAYVAVFSISRTGGVGLVYPTREDQALAASPPGANHLPVSGRVIVSLYDVDRTREERGILAAADAYYIIASTRPLQGMAEMIRTPRAVGTFLDRFRATSLSAGDEIGFALTRGLSDDEWAEDTYFGSRLPFQSTAAMQRSVMRRCPAKGGVYSVRMTSTARCEPLRRSASRGKRAPVPKPSP